MKASSTFALLAVIMLVGATPDSHHDEDDFWAQKPMHTTDLMAGKAQMATGPSITHKQASTAVPEAPSLDKDVNEL